MIVVKHCILLCLQILKRREHKKRAKHPVTGTCVADIRRGNVAHARIVAVAAVINVVVGVVIVARNHGA